MQQINPVVSHILTSPTNDCISKNMSLISIRAVFKGINWSFLKWSEKLHCIFLWSSQTCRRGQLQHVGEAEPGSSSAASEAWLSCGSQEHWAQVARWLTHCAASRLLRQNSNPKLASLSQEATHSTPVGGWKIGARIIPPTLHVYLKSSWESTNGVARTCLKKGLSSSHHHSSYKSHDPRWETFFGLYLEMLEKIYLFFINS